jgi:hypothetical protein
MLREWQQQEDEQKPASPAQPKVDDRRLPIKGAPGSGTTPGGQAPGGSQ